MHTYIKPLIAEFEKNANSEFAAQMKAYLKDRFELFGIKTPLKRLLIREFLAKHGKPDYSSIETVVFDLFSRPQRELHHAGIELCGLTKKDWKEDTISLFESMALTNSWWDSVDAINSICLRPFFLKFPDNRYEQTLDWIDSGNIWLQRLSIIFQLKYRDKTDTKLLKRNIAKLKDSNEFFVQKAIGWALRDYGYTNPDWVKSFVNRSDLKPLSRREALKRLNK